MEVQASPGRNTDWNTADLPSLIEHILLNFHKPLHDSLPRLESMLAQVTEEHLEKDARLSELRSTFGAMKAELESHMMKEEQILFPMILSDQGAFAGGPISVMEQEHESANAALKKIRELTDGFQAPDGACATWRELLEGLDRLERETHVHIHLENNILFPRALG